MTDLKPGKCAIIETSLGEIICELFPQHAPKTVENFVGLATGTKEFIDPKTRKPAKRPFYDGLIFHRVIPDFMIRAAAHSGPAPVAPVISSKMNSPRAWDLMSRASWPWPMPVRARTAASSS